MTQSPAETPAVKTYRYLRISMVGAVVLLGVSVLIERSGLSCWQTSVSAYYYTPVRAIFVGVLMAIGLSLIVIKGSTAWEDATLNAAGMLAPIVAVVPTTDVGRCWSQSPGQLPVDENGDLAAWVTANIDNNITALLITGIAGLLVAAVIASIATSNIKAVAEVGDIGLRLGLAAAMVFLLVGTGLFILWDDFNTRAHGIAAVLMFFFLALAVGGNAWDRRGDPAPRTYVWLYAATAAGMVIAPAIMFPLGSNWRHMVLVLEATEITLFAVFWLVQTREHWDETI
ncbi:MAG TPA: hypothetical protein VLN74_02785 [Ilumatobacteraceae bacterium]|nr:hypothetical protein [Ilumatobacteraceae bacterium]